MCQYEVRGACNMLQTLLTRLPFVTILLIAAPAPCLSDCMPMHRHHALSSTARTCTTAPAAVRLHLQLIRCFAGQSKTMLSTAMSNLRASGGDIDAEAFSSRGECLGKSAAGCCVVGAQEFLERGLWQVCCRVGLQTPVMDPLSLPLLCFSGHRQAT